MEEVCEEFKYHYTPLFTTTVFGGNLKTVSVRIGKDVVEELKRLKTHPRETYDDVIRRVLEEWKSMKSR